ncbi:MAG: regulator [Proteobacteria bacterium]|nr:regulator [Pseudomonadota bacterium]
MSTTTTSPSIPIDLYDHTVDWQPFAGVENLDATLCDVDEERQIVDVLVRFPPDKIVTMHNHLAQTNMFIIQGELRIYEPDDGSLREVRPAGQYYRGRRDDVHTEGGGPEGAVVLYSVRGHGVEELLQVMDNNQNVLASVSTGDIRDAWKVQQAGN